MANELTMLGESVAKIEELLGDELDTITLERAVFGLFFTGAKLSTGDGGLCFTPVKEMPEAVCCPSSAKAMPLSGRLRGRTARECLADIFCGNILRRTLGIAVLNALSMAVWKRRPPETYEILHGVDAFDALDVSKYKKTVVVGALVPMLKKLMKAGADFKVLEQDPRTLKEREMPHYLPPERAAECIPDADLLVITGVTILNDTLPGLLDLAKPEAEILVTGPTASMLPDAFFEHGVDMLGGIQVTNADELLDIISEAGSGYHFFGKSAERTVIRKRTIRKKAHVNNPEFGPSRDGMMLILDENIPFLDRRETLPLSRACGRTAAENLEASYSLPELPVGSLDGIAVRYDELQADESGDAAAPSDNQTLSEGTDFAWCNTGMAVPDGFDTVIPVEKILRLADGDVSVLRVPARKGENVRPAGYQIRRGETIIRRGDRLTPSLLGLLASAGVKSVCVYALPRVIFIPTGDELVPSGGDVPRGMNVESNSIVVEALLEEFGTVHASEAIVPDDPGSIRKTVAECVSRADLVIVSAGSSKGSKDFTMNVLDELGTVLVREIGVAPGKHLSLTMVGTTPVIGIPGPPGGAQLITRYYVHTAIQLLTSGKRREIPKIPAVLGDDVPGRWMDFMQSVSLRWHDGELRADPVPSAGSSLQESRNAFTQIVCCPNGQDLHKGDRVLVELPGAEMNCDF